MNIIEDRTIALAGVIQASLQVQALARQGSASEQESLLKSICVLDAVNSQAIYGGLEGVHSGLSSISRGMLNSAQAADIEVLKYTMQIITLQNQLYKDQQLFNRFAVAVERLSAYAESEFVSACSDVYQEFISPLRPQIIVQGEEEHLQTDGVPQQVRAMLLAGVRSAVLWQQKGGGKFRLVWERTRMQNAARSLLAQINIH